MNKAQFWTITSPRDKRAARILDRHYSRKVFRPGSIGVNQIGNNERCLVLVTLDYSALWVTTMPDKSARNDGLEIWLNQVFRNESNILSSTLISEAVALTRWRFWPYVPTDGMITYIAPDCIETKELPGYCYRRARPRFYSAGTTKDGKLVKLRLTKEQLLKVAPVEWYPGSQLRLAI